MLIPYFAGLVDGVARLTAGVFGARGHAHRRAYQLTGLRIRNGEHCHLAHPAGLIGESHREIEREAVDKVGAQSA